MLGKISPLQAQSAPEAAQIAPPVSAQRAPLPAPITDTEQTDYPPAAAPLTSVPSLADKDVLLAREAFERRDLKAIASAKDRLKSANGAPHPLTSYAEYWWLLANLAKTEGFAWNSAAEIRAFLNANADAVVADNLRREWLKVLGKQDRWALFAAEAPRLNIEDTEVNCHHWRYRLSRNDRDALTEAKAFWTAAGPAPDACDSVFAALMAEKLLPPADAWLRVRRLLENNQLADARKSAAVVPNLPANFERLTTLAGQNPAQYLQGEKLQPSSPASVELFLFAVTRLARTDAERAATLLAEHGKKLPANDVGYAWAQVGLYGGMQHDPSALLWFERASSFRLNDTQAGWKARAALRAADWATVEAAINAMSETARRESAWRYWRARALQEAGNADGARALREALARENNFYGVLAAEELGAPLSPDWHGWKPSGVEIAAVLRRPAIDRALALYRLDMREEGLREWQYGIRHMSDEQLLAAAEAARAANVPDRAINTAEKTLMVHDFTQRFPRPHRADLVTHARAQGLDEAWVYGLIRQESRFITSARSRVGAMGLMQLMPGTAAWAAKRVSMDRFSLAKVTDVPVNLSLGSYYLRHVLDGLGHPVLATAGYNAGPGRARRWRAAMPLEGAIYAETIPFTETRDYVKKVMVNAWFYAHQAGATTRRLKEMMGTVPGSTGSGSGGISSLASIALKTTAP